MKIVLISVLIFGSIVLYRRWKSKKKGSADTASLAPDKIESSLESFIHEAISEVNVIAEKAEEIDPSVKNLVEESKEEVINVANIVEDTKSKIVSMVDSVKLKAEAVESKVTAEVKQVESKVTEDVAKVKPTSKPKRNYNKKKKA